LSQKTYEIVEVDNGVRKVLETFSENEMRQGIDCANSIPGWIINLAFTYLPSTLREKILHTAHALGFMKL